MHKLICDECLPYTVVKYFLEIGYEVLWIKQEYPGITDKQVFHLTQEHQAILVTADSDFGGMVFISPLVDYSRIGFLYLRDLGYVQEVLKNVDILLQNKKRLRGLFVTITKNKIRIRNLKALYT